MGMNITAQCRPVLEAPVQPEALHQGHRERLLPRLAVLHADRDRPVLDLVVLLALLDLCTGGISGSVLTIVCSRLELGR